jgi:hypothetical protein
MVGSEDDEDESEDDGGETIESRSGEGDQKCGWRVYN